MQYPHTTPLKSPRSNKPVKNQNVITGYNQYGNKDSSMATTQYTLFQSYDSKIALIETDPTGPDILYLDPDYYNYSVTTSKYLHIFLRQHYPAISKFGSVKDAIKADAVVFKKLN